MDQARNQTEEPQLPKCSGKREYLSPLIWLLVDAVLRDITNKLFCKNLQQRKICAKLTIQRINSNGKTSNHTKENVAQDSKLYLRMCAERGNNEKGACCWFIFETMRNKQIICLCSVKTHCRKTVVFILSLIPSLHCSLSQSVFWKYHVPVSLS